jgi:hypothetical protein
MLFKDLEIGDKFSCNGLYMCTKKSSRTAYIDRDTKVLWFYFGQKENVSLGWRV